MNKIHKILTMSGLSLALTASTLPTAFALDEVKLSWDGVNYTSQIGESFIGLPISVPGDSKSRTLKVKNDGPTNGTMTVSIINVELKNKEAKESHHVNGENTGDFYDDVKITGITKSGSITKSFKEYDNEEKTIIGQFNIDKNEVTDVTIDYEFPFEATSGNKANVDERLATFDVLIEIQGADSEIQTPVPEPGTAPTQHNTINQPSVSPSETVPQSSNETAPAVGSQDSNTGQGMFSLKIANIILGTILTASLATIFILKNRKNKKLEVK